MTTVRTPKAILMNLEPPRHSSPQSHNLLLFSAAFNGTSSLSSLPFGNKKYLETQHGSINTVFEPSLVSPLFVAAIAVAISFSSRRRAAFSPFRYLMSQRRVPQTRGISIGGQDGSDGACGSARESDVEGEVGATFRQRWRRRRRKCIL